MDKGAGRVATNRVPWYIYRGFRKACTLRLTVLGLPQNRYYKTLPTFTREATLTKVLPIHQQNSPNSQR